MAHGITLKMRAIRPGEPQFVHQHPVVGKGIFGMAVPTTYRGPSRDRSLPGKARRQARKAARLLSRTPFFKGHGVASSNAHNLRYECPCGYGIISPLDDLDFMTDVMGHETEHAEGVA